MAFTFKKVLDDMSIGKSLFDDEGSKLVKGVSCTMQKNSVSLLFMDILFMDILFMDILFMDILFMDILFMDILFMDCPSILH